MSWRSWSAGAFLAERNKGMKYYQELTVLPDAELSSHVILSKAYQQIHIGLASQKGEDGYSHIGISFPEYRVSPCGLGCKVRLFAMDEEELERLDLKKLMNRLQDYVHITRIRPVPVKVKGYAVYSRFHQTKSVAQKTRRYAKRHGVSYESARELFGEEEMAENIPYIRITSLTNRHGFSLFIAREDRDQMHHEGFSAYGLSSTSTVPEF